jgi:hypothetical protein
MTLQLFVPRSEDKASGGLCVTGENELDQIQKIHKILGTPPQALLDKMKK